MLAAIDTLVQAAVAAITPERALGRHIDHIGIPWVHQNLADVLAMLQPHVLPGFPAIRALVHAIAVGNAALGVVLAGTHPNRHRVIGVQRHHANGITALAVEHRLPADAMIARAPDTARGKGQPDLRRVVRVHRQIRNAAGGDGRADTPQGHAIQHRALGFLAGSQGRQGQQQRQQNNDNTTHGVRSRATDNRAM